MLDEENGPLPEDEVIVEGDAPEVEDEAPDAAPEIEPESDDATDESDDEPDEGLTVSLEQEDDDEVSAPFRDLRSQNRDLKRRLKELEAKPTPEQVELGPRPTLEGSEFDEGVFTEKLLEWNEAKRAADAKADADRQAERKAVESYQERHQSYETAKNALGVKDFQEVEDAVADVLSNVQQSIVVDNAKRPELVVYALGKNPKKAAELAAETDPIKFAFKLAQLESAMTVTGVKHKPKPDQSLSGKTPPPQSGQKKLAEAFAKAQSTGDFSEYQRIKRASK